MINNNDFSVIKIKKNDELIGHKDYDLVKLIQKDVDDYRKDCYWVCTDCGYEIKYRTSLLMMGKFYVHEMRCQREISKGKTTRECKSKMHLHREDKKGFTSYYFDELFSRYQDKIVWESKKSHLIDHSDEVYSVLFSSFLKIVLQFDRNKDLSSKSDKWFSSFFWRSIQNKIADLQKTNTYNKRCPTTKCMLCGEDVGQITIKHLYSPGHDKLFKEMFIIYGERVLDDSGENYYYNFINEGDKKRKKRALHIGKSTFNKKNKIEKKKMFELECLGMYAKMFPMSIFKNRVSSINLKIGEDSETELIDLSNDSVLGLCQSPSNNIEIESSINILTDVIFNNLNDELDEYFKESFNKGKLKEIIREVLLLKRFFLEDSENKKIDSLFKVVKRGFTEKLLEFTRQNRNCRMFDCDGLGKEEKPQKRSKRRFSRIYRENSEKDLMAV